MAITIIPPIMDKRPVFSNIIKLAKLDSVQVYHGDKAGP